MWIDYTKSRYLCCIQRIQKGPDMHPRYHGVLQDTSQMTSSTIQKKRKKNKNKQECVVQI